MHISKFALQSCKCFDELELQLQPGVNVVVGKNNAGKSTLLKALKGQLGSIPHKSLTSVERRPSRAPTAHWEVVFSAEELRSELFRLETIGIPVPPSHGLETPARLLEYTLDQPLHPHVLTVGQDLRKPRLSSFANLYEWLQAHCNVVDAYVFNRNPFQIEVKATRPHVGWGQDFTHTLASNFLDSRVFLFDTERRVPSQATGGHTTQLNSDCSNFPQCLHKLFNESIDRYSRFVDVVRQVFPEVSWINPTQDQSAGRLDLHIQLWLHGASRADSQLAIGLEQCGSGLAQVMAICYILATQEEVPRVVVIDEPQSFLHPEASRSLMRLLQTFGQHQFIVSTHSPEVISALPNCSLHHVQCDRGVSTVSSSERQTLKHAREALADIGVRLGDVFGYDRVLWVEGETEERSFKKILEHFEPGLCASGLAINRVFATGDVDKTRGSRVLHVYKSLAGSGGLLPPMVKIVVDLEDRSAQACQELKRQSEGMIEFLPVPLVENYVLHPAALQHLIEKELTDLVDPDNRPQFPTVQEISALLDAALEKAKTNQRYQKQTVQGDIKGWVHGAKIIEDLLSHHHVNYYKPEHFRILCSYLLQHEPEEIRPLFEFLKRVLAG